ncbi:hypothetical protein J8273_3856 [Carpediemonas membranifera]|uniref:Uncharacterized protein n=1 Tax=Carpediemonas membranifera TaxID=201153 RepID=A0A8J6BCJ8_9EUKA|nr:hypothetical protein J8273_3856 [Carpediemonas membranifera]|eukprot:KAG9394602.1 hypothetical protein J8273_3856 [Carpediemonas membranifera]
MILHLTSRVVCPKKKTQKACLEQQHLEAQGSFRLMESEVSIFCSLCESIISIYSGAATTPSQKGFCRVISTRFELKKASESLEFPILSGNARKAHLEHERTICNAADQFLEHVDNSDLSKLLFASAHPSYGFVVKWNDWNRRECENDDNDHRHLNSLRESEKRVRDLRNIASHGGHLKNQKVTDNPSSISLSDVIGQINDGIRLLRPFAEGVFGDEYREVQGNVDELRGHLAFIEEYKQAGKSSAVVTKLIRELVKGSSDQIALDMTVGLIEGWMGRLSSLVDRLKDDPTPEEQNAAAAVVNYISYMPLAKAAPASPSCAPPPTRNAESPPRPQTPTNVETRSDEPTPAATNPDHVEPADVLTPHMPSFPAAKRVFAPQSTPASPTRTHPEPKPLKITKKNLHVIRGLLTIDKVPGIVAVDPKIP